MDVLIPFAKELSTGKKVYIDEVESGKACGCVCLFCGVPLIARKGQNQHHFAHEPKKVDEKRICHASFERALFWMSRTILLESHTLSTPELKLYKEDQRHNIKKNYTHPAKIIEYTHELDDDYDFNVDQDYILLNVRDWPLAIKIKVNSKDSFTPTKSDKDETLATLLIDLSSIFSEFSSREGGFRETLEKFILNDTSRKTWVFHPVMQRFQEVFASLVKKAHAQRNSIQTPRLKENFIIKRTSDTAQKMHTEEGPLQRFNKRMRALGHDKINGQWSRKEE